MVSIVSIAEVSGIRDNRKMLRVRRISTPVPLSGIRTVLAYHLCYFLCTTGYVVHSCLL
jgi:hypothetical protein